MKVDQPQERDKSRDDMVVTVLHGGATGDFKESRMTVRELRQRLAEREKATR
jgi:hypothetical protein